MNNYRGYNIQESICIESLNSIYYFEFDDDFVDEAEAHSAWEMVYVDRGECNVIADEETIPLQQGEIYFHKPYERHMLQIEKGNSPNVFIMTFRTASPAMRYFEHQKLDASLSTKQYIQAIIHEASNTFELPFDTLHSKELSFKSREKLWGGEQSIMIRLELMLIELVRKERYYESSPRMFHDKEIVTDEFCLKVIGYMEGRLYEKMSMDELCRALSFSRSYVSKRFAAVCGHSVMEYFTFMKIQEAKRLIRETDRNFQEVSDLLNFANSHYFSTMFKKYVGMTPTQYKKSCKRN
jgi:AraC-like DNA-binding protein